MQRIVKIMAGLVLASATFSSVALAADRHVIIINDTSSTLIHLFASNIGKDDWEEDILGSDVIASGDKVRANIDDGTDFCHYDIKAVFKDGSEAVHRNLNVCTTDSWTIHDGD